MLTLNFPRLLYNINMGTWLNTDKWDLRGSLPGKSDFLEKPFFHNNKGKNVLFHSVMTWGAHVAKNWGWPLVNCHCETEALSQTALEELNSANNQNELKKRSFPGWAFG